MNRHYSKKINPEIRAAGSPYYTENHSFLTLAMGFPTLSSDYLFSSDLSPMGYESIAYSSVNVMPPPACTGNRLEEEIIYYSDTSTLGDTFWTNTVFPCKYTPPERNMTRHDTMVYYTSPSQSLLSDDGPPPPTSVVHDVSPLHTPHLNRCRWLKCSLSYTTLDQLILHIRDDHVGSGKAAYICFWEGCPRHKKPFTKRHKMYNHMRTHTGERPFACTVPGCIKRFSRPDSLKTHIKTHSNIRPYHCKIPGCSKAYFHSRSLRKHTRSHEQKVMVDSANAVSFISSSLSQHISAPADLSSIANAINSK